MNASDLAFGKYSTATYHPATLSSGTLSLESVPSLDGVVGQAAKLFDKGNQQQTSTTDKIDIGGKTIRDVASGTVDIGFSDYFTSQQGNVTGVTDTQIAAQIYTLVVSQDLKYIITDLSTPQLIGIYTGQITNWNQVGGPNRAIATFTTATNSALHFAFQHYVLGNVPNILSSSTVANTTNEMLLDVANTQGAIGYVSTNVVLNATLASNLVPLCINGYGATLANIQSGNYAFWNIEHAYTPKKSNNSVAQAFLNFIRGQSFQQNGFPQNGFFGISLLPEAVIETHQVMISTAS